MAGTIGSVVNRASMPKLLRIHAAGLVLGALTMALALSLAGAVLRPGIRMLGTPLLLAVSAVLAGWALPTIHGRGLPFPYRSWQVPQAWRYRLPATVTAGLYGYLLGFGWLTYIVTPTYWLLFGGTLAVASLPAAALAWTAFALGRFLTTLRGARLAAVGSGDVTPTNVRAMRTLAGALLLLAALAITLGAA